MHKPHISRRISRLLIVVLVAPLCSAAANLTVSPANPRQLSNSTLQFTALLNKKDVSGKVQWRSSSSGVATIAPGGLATLLAPGTTTITAAHGAAHASTTLTVTIAAAPVFSAQPLDTNVSAVIDSNNGGVKVLMLDNLGNPLPSQNITISIGTNPPGTGTLSGTLAQLTDSTGTATFPDLKIDWLGTGYTLVASASPSSGLVSGTSSSFNELRVGDACLAPDMPACSSGCADTDLDGLNDAWENTGGVDVNGDGLITDATHDVLLPGANPNAPDTYLHYDYIWASDHNHNPPLNAIQYMVDAFAAHGITLHIDAQHNAICEIAGAAGCTTVGTGGQVVTLGAPGSGNTDPNCAGPSAVSMTELRKGIPYLNQIKPAYHYMVFAHYASIPTGGGPWACPTDPENPACGSIVSQPPAPGNLGTAEIAGNDAIVATQPFVDSGAVPDLASIPAEWWAGLGMHEFGHNLALLHGGADCFNRKPNYVSAMSYTFYVSGIPAGALPGDSTAKSCTADADCNSGDHAVSAHCSTFTNSCFRVDYSDRIFNELDEAGGSGGLDENLGLQGGANNTDLSYWFANTSTAFVKVPTNGSSIDWNKNGETTDVGIAAEVNDDGMLELLTSQNDWEAVSVNGILQFVNLRFGYQCDPNYGN